MKLWTFIKIQSSYLLSSYQRNQALISNYISYFLNNFLVSLYQELSYMFVIRDKILFLKCNWWKWKIKVEIKVKEGYIKGPQIFVFTIFITYIDDLKINVNNVIDWHFANWSFFRESKFSFFFFEGARLESWKVRLSSSIL